MKIGDRVEKLSTKAHYKVMDFDNKEGEIVLRRAKWMSEYYYKNRSESNYIISRMGRGEYERHPEESFIENSLTLSDKEIASFIRQLRNKNACYEKYDYSHVKVIFFENRV